MSTGELDPRNSFLKKAGLPESSLPATPEEAVSYLRAAMAAQPERPKGLAGFLWRKTHREKTPEPARRAIVAEAADANPQLAERVPESALPVSAAPEALVANMSAHPARQQDANAAPAETATKTTPAEMRESQVRLVEAARQATEFAESAVASLDAETGELPNRYEPLTWEPAAARTESGEEPKPQAGVDPVQPVPQGTVEIAQGETTPTTKIPTEAAPWGAGRRGEVLPPEGARSERRRNEPARVITMRPGVRPNPGEAQPR